MYQHISPREELIKQAKGLRKLIYIIDENMHDKIPKKRENTGLLEGQIISVNIKNDFFAIYFTIYTILSLHKFFYIF